MKRNPAVDRVVSLLPPTTVHESDDGPVIDCNSCLYDLIAVVQVGILFADTCVHLEESDDGLALWTRVANFPILATDNAHMVKFKRVKRFIRIHVDGAALLSCILLL